MTRFGPFPPVDHGIRIEQAAVAGPDLLAVARLLVGDLMSGFGVAQPPQFTPDRQQATRRVPRPTGYRWLGSPR